MLMLTLAISCLTTFNLPRFMDLTCQALDFTSIPSHIHNWVLLLLWLHLITLSGVISPLFSSNILGTYWPGEFIFQCPIFLLFHTVHGVLKARILKWFAIPFSNGPRFVECRFLCTTHRNLSVKCRSPLPTILKLKIWTRLQGGGEEAKS